MYPDPTGLQKLLIDSLYFSVCVYVYYMCALPMDRDQESDSLELQLPCGYWQQKLGVCKNTAEPFFSL